MHIKTLISAPHHACPCTKRSQKKKLKLPCTGGVTSLIDTPYLEVTEESD